MADASPVTYDLLSSQDELGIVSNALRQAESQHYSLTVSRMGLTPNPNDAQLPTLVSQIDALQTEYTRVKALVDAAAAQTPETS